jgi:DNA-directed RNA polymerase subunit F
MGQSEIAKRVALLRAAFPRENIPETTVALYVMKLSDIGPELLEAAVNRLIEEVKFFPAISEVRHMAAKLAGLLPPSSAEALAIVRRADRREPVLRRDGSLAYEERCWEWPEDITEQTLEVCRGVVSRIGDPVDPRSEKDRFGWESSFREVYDSQVTDISIRLLADLSGAELPRLLEPGNTPISGRLDGSHER